MKKFLILLTCVILTSCCRKISNSTITNTIYKDSTIVVTRIKTDSILIPGDTVKLKVLIKCPDGGIPIVTTGRFNSKQSEVNTSFKNNTLSVEAICKQKDVIIHWQDSVIREYKNKEVFSEKKRS